MLQLDSYSEFYPGPKSSPTIRYCTIFHVYISSYILISFRNLITFATLHSFCSIFFSSCYLPCRAFFSLPSIGDSPADNVLLSISGFCILRSWIHQVSMNQSGMSYSQSTKFHLILSATVVGTFPFFDSRFNFPQLTGAIFPFPLPFRVPGSPYGQVYLYRVIWL